MKKTAFIAALVFFLGACGCSSGNNDDLQENDVITVEETEAPADAETLADEAQSEDSAFFIKITDENGSPVTGVMITFCDEESCEMLTTDDDGVVKAEREPKAYEVHVVSVPEGYEAPEDAFSLDENNRSVTIVLKTS